MSGPKNALKPFLGTSPTQEDSPVRFLSPEKDEDGSNTEDSHDGTDSSEIICDEDSTEKQCSPPPCSELLISGQTTPAFSNSATCTASSNTLPDKAEVVVVHNKSQDSLNSQAAPLLAPEGAQKT